MAELQIEGTPLLQQQLDEMELLQAMSKTGEFHWSQGSLTGTISGTMNVSIQLDGPIKLNISRGSAMIRQCLRDDSDIVPSKSAASNQSLGMSETATELLHLPPVSLYFQLPLTYPVSDPPSYSISCKWMNFSFLSELCTHLDQLWSDGVGTVILYTWQQFLTNESLTLLGVGPDRYYLLRIEDPTVSNPDWDPRAVQDIGLPQLLLSQLIEYNRCEKERYFNEAFFNCEICFLSLPGSKCIKIIPCDHVHCKECLSSFFSTKIKEGDVSIDCPSSGCTSTINTTIIKDLVSPQLFERFDSLLLQRTLEGMNDIFYCPRPSCQCVTLKEDDSNMSLCPRCRFAFCILCKRAWHGVSPCKLLPCDLKDLRATWETLDYEGKKALERQYGKTKLEQAFQELDSSTWIECNAKQCPNCDSNIEKTDGCNKMTCTQCRSHFCWLCDASLPQHDPYGHFRLVSGNYQSRCAGKLFEGMRGFDEDFWH